MSEHRLPDDLARWPSNPFELLGIEPGTTERELRRVYARLIRLFKPELFPEHFRRIRQAYETASHFTRPAQPHDAASDSSAPASDRTPPSESVQPNPEAAAADSPDAQCPAPASTLRSLEEDLDEAWNWAVDGDERRAYARLLELLERQPQRSEIHIRLYSLLGAFSELDQRLTPCDFLIRGLRQTGGLGPCHELYRREIEDQPGEATSARFAELLEYVRQTAQPMFATFLEWRWSAVGRLGRVDVIHEDLAKFGSQLANENEEVWLQLLVFAADQLAWMNTTFLNECLEEAYKRTHLQLRCGYLYDRLEFLEQAASGWHLLRDRHRVPADLLELLAHSGARPFSEIRPRVMALLANIAKQPRDWLSYFDTINHISAPVLSLFGRLLDACESAQDRQIDNRDPEQLAALAQRCLEEHGHLKYIKLRPRLLAFCRRELIDPDVVARVAISQAVSLPPVRLNKLVADWPLRHVYRACRLLWSCG